jgi:hypothetical protein
MSTYAESESSSPTARDLLELLKKIEEKDPKWLDQPVCTWDEEVGYTAWLGVLELDEEDGIRISYEPNDVIKAEYARMRDQAQRAAREEYLRLPEGRARTKELEEARRQGLLP